MMHRLPHPLSKGLHHEHETPDTYFGPTEFFGTLDDPEAETESVCFVGEEEIVALTDLENASELDAEDAFPQLATAFDVFILT